MFGESTHDISPTRLKSFHLLLEVRRPRLQVEALLHAIDRSRLLTPAEMGLRERVEAGGAGGHQLDRALRMNERAVKIAPAPGGEPGERVVVDRGGGIPVADGFEQLRVLAEQPVA